MNKISPQGGKWAADLGKNKNVKLVESCYRERHWWRALFATPGKLTFSIEGCSEG